MVIYKVTLPNTKIYIGQTIKTLSLRKSVHLNHVKSGSSNPFHNALRKYGIENSIWEIIDTAETLEELNKKETYWILHLNSICSSEGGNGYNITFGGDNRRHSKSSKEKMSLAKKGKKILSDEFYKKLSLKFQGKNNPFYGKTHTLENKLKLSAYRKNKKLTEEHKSNISTALNVGKIIAINKNTGEIVGEFLSASDCARKLNLNVGHICSVLRGNTKLRSHKGLIFKRSYLNG